MKKFFNIIFVILITLIFDLIFTYLLISNFNFYEKFYPDLDHRVTNVNYHHSFKNNVDTFDYWGGKKYKFYTNSLGFKDSFSRQISKKTSLKKRIIIIGDSFTEGIGFEYKDTFVGLLDKKNLVNETQILNAGVASQSPIIYFKKIKHLIEVQKVEFDELIIFLDISDIPDEYYYGINFDNNDNKVFNLRDYLQEFLIQNSSLYLFFDVLFSKIGFLKDNLILKYNVSKKFNINFFKINKYYTDLFKSINVERGMWNHDLSIWNLYGKKGRKLADFYLSELQNICDNNKIKLSLVIYPWPIHIYYGYDPAFHRNYWKEWSKKRNIQFIDLFDYFKTEKPEKTINDFFISGDIHWNKRGHRYIYEIMMNEYF